MEDKEKYTPEETADMINKYLQYEIYFESNEHCFEKFRKSVEEDCLWRKEDLIIVADNTFNAQNKLLETYKKDIPENIRRRTDLERTISNHLKKVKSCIFGLSEIKPN